MTDIATTLNTALERALDGVTDEIAKEGLKALKRVLDGAGFSQSEYLKNYQVYAHVIGHSIVYEIVLDIEAVVPEDQATQQALATVDQQSAEAVQEAARTYGLVLNRPQRRTNDGRRDARRPARDARRPARDARRTSRDRLVAKEIANFRPRSATVTRSGRLSVALKRSVRATENEVKFPRGQFQGVLGTFMKELKQVVLSKFAPILADIVRNYGTS